MSFTKIITLCAVAAALLMADPAHAQFIDRLLFYDEDTGAHATASIEDPGELAIRMVYPDRFELLLGDDNSVKIATTEAGIFVYKRVGLFNPPYARNIRITFDGVATYGPEQRGCEELVSRMVALGNYIFCYHDFFGHGVLGAVNNRGDFTRVFDVPTKVFEGYDHAIRTANLFFFYNSETGLIAVGQIRQSVITGQSYFEATELGETDGGFTTIAAVHDRVLLYNARSGAYQALRFELTSTDPSVPGNFQGQYIVLQEGTLARGMYLAETLNEHIMLYDQNSGNYAVGRLGFNGNFNIRQSGLTSPGYGRIAGVGRYLVFLDYNQFLPPTGKAVIGTILPTGEYRELKKINVGPYNGVVSARG